MNQGFLNDLRSAINCASAENGSDTPDFILAEFLSEVLDAWDRAVTAREKWYGREKKPIVLEGPNP